MEYGNSKILPKKVDKAYDKHLKKTFDDTKRGEPEEKGTFEQLLNSGFIKGMQTRREENLSISKEFAAVREERKRAIGEDELLIRRFEKGILKLWSNYTTTYGSVSKIHSTLLYKLERMKKKLPGEIFSFGHYSTQGVWEYDVTRYTNLLLSRSKEGLTPDQIKAEKKRVLKQFELSISTHRAKLHDAGYVFYTDQRGRFHAKARSASDFERNDNDYFPSSSLELSLSYINWATIISNSIKLLNEKGIYEGDLGAIPNDDIRRTVGKIMEVSLLIDRVETNKVSFEKCQSEQLKVKKIENELRNLFSNRNKEGGMKALLEKMKEHQI